MSAHLAGPSPDLIHPMTGVTQVAFLKPLIDHPMVDVGDYTYYDDPAGPERFLERCVRYHFPHMKDRLVIGRFCAIASGAEFVMNGANHTLDGFSTYPFAAFGNGWGRPGYRLVEGLARRHDRGNDVWIGTGATILPGVTIGDGAIIGSRRSSALMCRRTGSRSAIRPARFASGSTRRPSRGFSPSPGGTGRRKRSRRTSPPSAARISGRSNGRRESRKPAEIMLTGGFPRLFQFLVGVSRQKNKKGI
ncbi:MAG: hypothetical protein R3C58_08395 [Parvularculaceae bacterium]